MELKHFEEAFRSMVGGKRGQALLATAGNSDQVPTEFRRAAQSLKDRSASRAPGKDNLLSKVEEMWF